MRLLLALLLVCGQAWATTYYADFVSGSDSNAGTSTSAPWKRFPGMQSEAVSPSLSSGDTVCMKGGVTWTNMFQPVSGVAYKGNCPGWGSGYAKVSETSQIGALLAISTDNWSVEHIHFTNSLMTQNYHGAAYIEGTNVDSVTGITITDCRFSDSGQGLMLRKYTDGATVTGVESFNNTYPASLSSASSGILISGPGTQNITIRGTDALPTKVYGNGLTAVVAGLSEGRGITVGDNVTLITLDGVKVWGNGEAAGLEGSQLEGGISTYVNVKNSSFDGNTAAEIKKGADNWTIVGNLFRGTSAGVFQYGYESPSNSINSTIAHNVIVSTRNTSNAAMKLSSPGTGMSVRNNIVILPSGHTASGIEFNRTGTSWAMSTWDGNFDHNSVYGGTGATIEVAPGPSYTNRTLAQHRSAYPNQAAGGTESDPQFLGVPATADITGFRLRSGSPLVAAGVGVGNYKDRRGCPYALGTPNIGLYAACAGDPAPTRTPR